MKFQLTIEGDSPAELYEVVDRLRGRDVEVVVDMPAVTNAAVEAFKEIRKKRADAGKPRGPYKTTGEAPASAPGTTEAHAGAPTPAAAPTPTQSAAPAQAATPAPESAAPAAAAPLTEADIRKALKAVNDKAGLGMPACRELLLSFGVEQISKVTKDRYAEFIEACQKKVNA